MVLDEAELRQTIFKLVGHRGAARRAADGVTSDSGSLWAGLVGNGVLGLSLPEMWGGLGGGIEELAIVVEELSYFVAPVQIIPAFLANIVLASQVSSRAERLAEALHSGESVVGACISTTTGVETSLAVERTVNEPPRLSGSVTDVLDGGMIDILIVHAEGAWWVVDTGAEGVSLSEKQTIDPTRRVATIGFDRTAVEEIGHLSPVDVLAAAWILCAAEGVGIARAAMDLAVNHALIREQFGQKIGRFQAVKQKLADCLLSLEGARSAVWGAVRTSGNGAIDRRAASVAKLVATQACVSVTGEAVQLHGAMGVTWEHDLHLLLRRGKFLQLAFGSPSFHAAALSRQLLADASRSPARPGVEETSDVHMNFSVEDRLFLDELRGWLDVNATPDRVKEARAGGQGARRQWQADMADAGWVGIHWPAEHGGRDASFTQQVLYHSELARRGLPPFVGNRGLSQAGPTLIRHGSEWQRSLLEPTRRAEILWATGFSERGAGSDLASLRTRGVVDGGDLIINGHKIWTSSADQSDWLFALIRTGPLVPKHDGISCVLVPLSAAGLTVNPIRLNDGSYRFNEIFFDEVRVPLTNIVGPMGGGWKVARTTLAHEHFTNFLGTHAAHSRIVSRIIQKLEETERAGVVDHDLRARIADAWVNSHLLRLNGLRNVMKVQAGEDPGPEGSIQKLIGQEQERSLFELALDVEGAAGLTNRRYGNAFLSSRAATIGGGTSEVHRNKLAERVLGMPRDLWAEDVVD